MYPKLNEFLADKWKFLEVLNALINGQLHLPLPSDKTKELILPTIIGNYGKVAKQIAKKSNVVANTNALIAKNEESVSSWNLDSKKKL